DNYRVCCDIPIRVVFVGGYQQLSHTNNAIFETNDLNQLSGTFSFHRVKTILAFAAVLSLVLIGSIGIGTSYADDGDIEINEVNFPDENFREFLLDPKNISGAGQDGVLTLAERNQITSLKISSKGLTSLKGIEFFTELTKLDVEGNYLTEVDISANTKLKVVYLRNNQLKSIDFSRNTALEFIEIFDNRLQSIDVSMLPDLRFLHIDHNNLTTLDLTENRKLEASGFVARNNPHLHTIKLPNIPGENVRLEDFVEQDPVPGYGHAQWYIDAAPDVIIGTGDQTQPQGTIPMNGQVLYSKREPNTYTVKYVPGASNVEGAEIAHDAVWDQEVVVHDNPFTREGYIFKGWQLPTTRIVTPGESLKNIAGSDKTNDLVKLVAVWEKDPTIPDPDAGSGDGDGTGGDDTSSGDGGDGAGSGDGSGGDTGGVASGDGGLHEGDVGGSDENATDNEAGVDNDSDSSDTSTDGSGSHESDSGDGSGDGNTAGEVSDNDSSGEGLADDSQPSGSGEQDADKSQDENASGDGDTGDSGSDNDGVNETEEGNNSDSSDTDGDGDSGSSDNTGDEQAGSGSESDNTDTDGDGAVDSSQPSGSGDQDADTSQEGIAGDADSVDDVETGVGGDEAHEDDSDRGTASDTATEGDKADNAGHGANEDNLVGGNANDTNPGTIGDKESTTEDKDKSDISDNIDSPGIDLPTSGENKPVEGSDTSSSEDREDSSATSDSSTISDTTRDEAALGERDNQETENNVTGEDKAEQGYSEHEQTDSSVIDTKKTEASKIPDEVNVQKMMSEGEQSRHASLASTGVDLHVSLLVYASMLLLGVLLVLRSSTSSRYLQ
ncbi:MAG: hypothetical protein Q4P66_07360, partial [Actinomycetaceae bacterium]|nr:hypothetical protein [Actinomycetaceae bacterium]